MLKKGYVFEREVASSGATDVRYSGKIQGMPATILNYFNDKNQLVKTSIVFEKNYNSSLYRNWTNLKDSIVAKYGVGIDLSTVAKSRSYEYDFQIESELNNNKTLSYGWIFPTYNYAISLDVQQPFVNNNDYFVTLAYESPAWGGELKRRQNAGDL